MVLHQLKPARNLLLKDAFRIILFARRHQVREILLPVAPQRVLARISIVQVLEGMEQTLRGGKVVDLGSELSSRVLHDVVGFGVGPEGGK